MEIDVDTQSLTVLVELEESYIVSLDYDYEKRHVYFSRLVKEDIMRYVIHWALRIQYKQKVRGIL